MPTKFGSLCLFSFVCVGALAAPPSAHAGGLRLVTTNGGSVASLMRSCVESYVKQGLSFELAAEECSNKGFPGVPETQIDGEMLTRPGNTADINVPACSGTNVDPSLASPIEPAAKAARYVADSLESSYMRAQNAWEYEGDPLGLVGMEIYRIPMRYADKIATALELLDKYLNDHGVSGSDHETSTKTISGCEEAAATIGACNAEGWKTGPCEVLRKKLDSCADPLNAMIDPDGETTCRNQHVDGDTVEKLVLVVCAKDAKVAPGHDPCQVLEGVVTRRNYRMAGDPEHPTCSDPRALVQPEDCIDELNVIEFGDNIGDVVREAETKLGGPVVVIPVPAPFDCGLRPCS